MQRADQSNYLISNNEYSQFWALWFEHQPRIRSCCLRWLNGNQASVEDALSQIIEKAHKYYLKTNEVIRSPFSWLCKVAHNICIDIHRENKKQLMFCSDMSDNPEQYFFSIYESEELEEQIMREKKLESLIKTLDLLKSDLKEVIYHRFIDEMEYSEIAEVLCTTQENVRKRVQIARKELRLLIKG